MLQLPKRFHPDFSQPKVKPKGPVEIDYSVAPKGTRVWLNNSQALSGGAFTKTGDAYYKDDYFNFDGSGDYLDCGSDPIFQSEDFTLIAVCSDFVNVSSGSICGQGGSSPSQGWTLRYDQYATANKVGFTKFGVSDGQSSITCPFATPNVVIALTFSGNNAIMCVDGAVSTVSFAAPINAQTSPKFVIGGAWRTGSFISDGGFKLHMLAAIPKNVSTARLVALAANPYNLLKPANDTWFFPVSAAGGSVDVSSTDMLLNAILDTHIITLTKDLVSNNLTVTPSLATHPVTLERTVVVEDLLLTPSLGSSALTLSRTVNNDPLTVTPELGQSAMTQTVGAGSNDMTLVPSLGSNTVALTVTVGNNDLTAVTYFDTHSISIAGVPVVDVSSSSMTLTPILDPSSTSLTHSVTHNDLSLATALDSSAMSLVINTLSSDMLVTAIFESSTFGSAIFYGSSDMRLDTQLDDHNISSAINLLNSDIMVLPFFDSSGITRSVSVVNENMYVVTRLESSSFTTLNFMDVDSHTIHLQSLSIEYQIESLTVNYMVIEG